MSDLDNLQDNELHLAVHCGDRDGAKTALDNGIDPNLIGLFGWNALHEAANNGELELLKVLVTHGGDCNKKDSLNGYTPLHYASSEGYSECLEYLILAGGDLCVESNRGQTVAQVTRDKSCKKVLSKYGIHVKSSVQFDKRSVKKTHNKTAKSGRKNKNLDVGYSGSLPKLTVSDESELNDGLRPVSLRTISSSLSGEYSARSCSSLHSLTSLGSSIDDGVAGYLTLAFQYNRKTSKLVISISNLILTRLRTYELSKKESSIPLHIEGCISHNTKMGEVNSKSNVFKLDTNGTEDSPVRNTANGCKTYWNNDSAIIKFNPALNLEFISVKSDDIPQQNVAVSVLMQKKKSLLKSSGQHVAVASMQLPLSDAVKRILKERYELGSCHDEQIHETEHMLSNIVISSGSVISDSVVIGINRPSAVDTTRCVSDGDLQYVSSEKSKKHLSPHSTVCIPEDSKPRLQVKSHSTPPSPQVEIRMPASTHSSDDDLEIVVSQ